ncbi:MAG TPA: DUF1800 domain-containing protein [Candidatus Acidoferrales bacterium]|nr:DUF1800 domain-containing protein [Candidatus Acidoferrales bacterium]
MHATPGHSRVLATMLGALLTTSLTFAAPYLSAGKHKKEDKQAQSKILKGLPVTELSDDEAILHALNRLGFGPRPSDIERVRRMGLEKWIEQQLDPSSIDDSALEARLEKFPTLAMSASQLLDRFPQPKQAAKQAGLSREEFQKQREEMRREHAQQQAQGSAQSGETGHAQEAERNSNLPDSGKPARLGVKGQGLVGDPNSVRMNFEEVHTPQRIIAELSMAKMTRAVYSERQLYEELVDFWFNHFNVFAGKGADRWLLTSYERDVIRPHALGKFKDLLSATAKSPAMLFYLDNWLSADPKAFERMQRELALRRERFYGMYGMRDSLSYGRLGPPFPPDRRPPGQPRNLKKERGLNENYARELMELHTLGVDGGYTQQDVIEVARCFTGWTMKAPRHDPEFHFDDRIHDPGSKTVLGQKIHAGGMKDGEQVLAMLARHPNTAKFISTKLARHFVSDNPPAALVDRMAKTFLDTDGDIRAVLRAMIYSPEFWARQTYRAKIKTPFELVASTARAVSADVEVPLPLVMWTARIGEPLYQCQPPTGYSDKAETWVNTGALLNRLNFSLALAGNRMRAIRVDVPDLLGQEVTADPQTVLERALTALLSNQASPQTRATLEKQLADPQVLQAELDDPVSQVNAGVIAGLVLGAPEFQRR